jgi:hypothetical protein
MLKDKVVIVTGASSGIGRSLSLLLARDGAVVVSAARRLQKILEVEKEIRSHGGKAIGIRCDVTNRSQAEELVHRTVRDFGRIDVLVNNAGRGHFASVEDTTDEVISSMFSLNVYSLWNMVRPALTYMKRQKSGHIINVASMAGKLGYPYNSAYVAAKHACVGFTHALRAELMETGIHASVVCPAGVLTEWASSTEGEPMLPFFSASGPIIKSIAADRQISLPSIEGLLSPDAVAEKIVECINSPVAEVYTHKGSREFFLLSAGDREQAERHQLPVVLGERQTYDQMKKDTTRSEERKPGTN